MTRSRPSRAVYRRRRFVVFGGLILLIAAIAVGVWMLIAQPWANAAAPAATPTSAASEATASETPSEEPVEPDTEDPSPVPTESAQAAAACRGADILVEAVTDADSYDSETLPKLSISLTNQGAEPCTIDVGSATQEFVITSGADVWWRSTDCQQEPSSYVITLDAGQNLTTAEPLVWDRTRSATDTCDQENRPRAAGGGASYHLSVGIGGFTSMNTRLFMLY